MGGATSEWGGEFVFDEFAVDGRHIQMCSQTPNDAAVTVSTSADTPNHPRTKLRLHTSADTPNHPRTKLRLQY